MPVALRRDAAGLEARQIEHVAHVTLQRVRILADRLHEIEPRRVVDRRAVVDQRRCSARDGRERRSQVVAHRTQHHVAQPFFFGALPRRDRMLADDHTMHRHGDVVGEGLEQSLRRVAAQQLQVHPIA